jgi:hypothetical protein
MFLALWQNVNLDGEKSGEISYFGPYPSEQAAKDAIAEYCKKDTFVSVSEFWFEPLSLAL